MKINSLALLAAAVVACRPAAVPASEEPRHHLVYSNDIVHVMDIRVPAGDTTLWHTHAYPLAVVHLRNARDWDQALGRDPDPVAGADPVPSLSVNWDRPQPYTHRVGNVDTVGFHYVAAEWLKSSGVKCDSMPDTPARKLVNAGPSAIIYELTLAPHSSMAAHTHACPGLVVQATAGTLLTDGPPAVATGGSGEGGWYWHAPGLHHTIRNDGPTRMIVYELDWR